MSDETLLLDAAERLFTVDGGPGWDEVAAMGLPLALVPEEAGGFGLDLVDALALVRAAGTHAAALPLVETMWANRALALAGLPVADGMAAFVPEGGMAVRDGRVTGHAARVPWGREVGVLAVELGDRVVRVERGGWSVAELGTNLAGAPRDLLAVDAPADAAGRAHGPAFETAGAALRALQIAGALEAALDLTVAHVGERVQFGRALSQFQAVQHEVARLGGEVAAASAAADIAAEALGGGGDALAVAAASVRAREAAGVGAGIAQQLHGAIGFTREYRLHRLTAALWSWRDEYGSQRSWTDRLGTAALGAGGDGYWPFATGVAA